MQSVIQQDTWNLDRVNRVCGCFSYSSCVLIGRSKLSCREQLGWLGRCCRCCCILYILASRRWQHVCSRKKRNSVCLTSNIRQRQQCVQNLRKLSHGQIKESDLVCKLFFLRLISRLPPLRRFYFWRPLLFYRESLRFTVRRWEWISNSRLKCIPAANMRTSLSYVRTYVRMSLQPLPCFSRFTCWWNPIHH